MDDRSFDHVARRLGARVSRRAFVATIAVALAGGGDAAAACRGIGSTCAASSSCCSGYCERRTSVPRAQRNRCACAPGSALCGATCRALQTDPANCGACGAACAAGRSCVGGACYALQTDVTNCGSVGHLCVNGEACQSGVCRCGIRTTCTSGQYCSGGSCVTPGRSCSAGGGLYSCSPGQICCNRVCRRSGTDASNCGSCGNVCDPGEICVNGSCA